MKNLSGNGILNRCVKPFSGFSRQNGEMEFWNEKNPDPNMPSDFVGDGNEGMFRFQKKMKN